MQKLVVQLNNSFISSQFIEYDNLYKGSSEMSKSKIISVAETIAKEENQVSSMCVCRQGVIFYEYAVYIH